MTGGRARTLALLGLLSLVFLDPALAAKKPKGPPPTTLAGVAVARLAYVDGLVERQGHGQTDWDRIKQGAPMRTGDRVRTAVDGTVRIAFPWMSLTASPGTTILIPATVVLSTVLEEGRVEVNAFGRDIVKLKTDECEIRGQGRVVARRRAAEQVVLVMAREGRFRVEAQDSTVSFPKGEGTTVRAGMAPEPAGALPPAPGAVIPGADPAYVRQGEPVRLAWSSSAPFHTVEILPVDSEDVSLAREAGPSPLSVDLPWIGTWRWRVSARDTRGLEGPSSAEGLVCIVDR
jgi:hypothetical protein